MLNVINVTYVENPFYRQFLLVGVHTRYTYDTMSLCIYEFNMKMCTAVLFWCSSDEKVPFALAIGGGD